eukprot:CAMPEP_0183723966 /NCGR_PEP_ID=MMETSP0737-20130205/16851_1 /TAXON_ID=385413 /ORGANISM="Thalassiosira miniscula, Strain CCMP1093" /LENGTH=199 /DNA_ID=CAMNT_0025954401 /DNA_START=158 /DNA_END=758 /DNA_ORIENTATION=+
MLNVGHALDGFWETGPGGPCVLNSTKTQGRMYRALDQYGPTLHALFHRLGQEVHAIACAADPSMPAVLPSTHALVLYYATQRGLGEHRDDGPNDGSSDQPVISFNLGKAVDFSVRHEKSDDNAGFVWNGGNAILFGGPCRRILHSVAKIYPKTNPLVAHGLEDVRLNLTLRYAPEILGKEDKYKFFKPVQGSARSKEKA